jgi:hypothetical protein
MTEFGQIDSAIGLRRLDSRFKIRLPVDSTNQRVALPALVAAEQVNHQAEAHRNPLRVTFLFPAIQTIYV